MELIADGEPVLDEPEAMDGWHFRGVERERSCRDNDNDREEIVSEESRRHNTGSRHDTERDVPVRALGLVIVFSPFPLEDGWPGHASMITDQRLCTGPPPPRSRCVILWGSG